MALVDIANGKSRHVHYRDSKLTFLLRVSGCQRRLDTTCSFMNISACATDILILNEGTVFVSNNRVRITQVTSFSMKVDCYPSQHTIN